MTGTGNQMLKEKGDINVNRRNMKGIIKGRNSCVAAKGRLLQLTPNRCYCRASSNWPYPVPYKLSQLFFRDNITKLQVMQPKHVRGRKCCKLHPSQSISPYRIKRPGQDRNLNAGTLSEGKGLLSMKSQCWNAVRYILPWTLDQGDRFLSLASATIVSFLCYLRHLCPYATTSLSIPHQQPQWSY